MVNFKVYNGDGRLRHCRRDGLQRFAIECAFFSVPPLRSLHLGGEFGGHIQLQTAIEKMFFDTQTGLLIRYDFEAETSQGKFLTQSSFDDYKEVEG